jgi:hypothetical protein
MHKAGSILYASLVNHTYEFLSVTHHQISLDSSHRLVRGASYEGHYGNGCRWRAHLRSTKLEQWKRLLSVKGPRGLCENAKTVLKTTPHSNFFFLELTIA